MGEWNAGVGRPGDEAPHKAEKTGFELLEHVTGGVHVDDDGRIMPRPLDELSDKTAPALGSAGKRQLDRSRDQP